MRKCNECHKTDAIHFWTKQNLKTKKEIDYWLCTNCSIKTINEINKGRERIGYDGSESELTREEWNLQGGKQK